MRLAPQTLPSSKGAQTNLRPGVNPGLLYPPSSDPVGGRVQGVMAAAREVRDAEQQRIAEQVGAPPRRPLTFGLLASPDHAG